MANELFINYRRTDNPSMAHLLADRFKGALGEEAVFLDVLSIEAGAKWRARIAGRLACARALVAVIGRNWLEVGSSGEPRLFDENDPVRWEIATALERNIHVFPVLEHNVSLPKKLPSNLEGLRDHNYSQLMPNTMDDAIRNLVGAVRMRLNQPPTTPPPDPRVSPKEPDGSGSEVELARGRFAVPIGGNKTRLTHWLRPGDDFRDLADAPVMVVIPPGMFMMGASDDDPHASPEEKPRHAVRIERQFAISRHLVTIEEWNTFASACPDQAAPVILVEPKMGHKPVLGITWHEAWAYTAWLSQQTDQPYRLPSEAEWEYAARAGTITPYWWGRTPDRLEWCRSMDAAGRRRANPWGLCGMIGAADQWVEDDWHPSYKGAAANANAWLDGLSDRKTLRGGSFKDDALHVRTSSRSPASPATRADHIGFRIARSLDA